ncbi:hypothetical protein Tco_1148745 [Tanacetum coccineum]
MLLYSWDRGLDVCVDLTGSSLLTQTGMVDFAPSRGVIDDAQRKRSKYMAKCAAIGYGFLLFSFSSLGELEADVVTLLKRIRKFSMTQDIRARAVVYIFNMISFAIAKRVRAQIATLEDIKTKHPFHPAPSLPHISTDHHHLIASSTVVLDRIKSFPRGTSCGRDGLCAQHLMDYLSGAVVAVSDELISSIT